MVQTFSIKDNMATPNTTFGTQILTSAQANNFPFGIVAGIRSTVATATPPNTTPVSFVSTPAFTPITNRIYRVTWAIGQFTKNVGGYNQDVYIRVGSTTGTIIDHVLYSALGTGTFGTITKTTYITTAQIGTTSSTTLWMTVQTNGSSSDSTFSSDANTPTILMIEDIGTTV